MTPYGLTGRVGIEIAAAPDLISLLNHLKGTQQLPQPQPGEAADPAIRADVLVTVGRGTPDLAPPPSS